ncbi:serine/arginine repetitive matrix protein 1 [Phlebotomus argentipes]|uniref:serine/arginine repetitive matrix protein 1 n=1 Tax=Phlebotomus argentipes TaxID=94469 RepID=UPI002892AC1B|nr:serine/arginine repetitive matrix protein 1 [Phlebotomus argentipes]
MSDIDDLLNYDENELGDEEDLVANEDELLLSDEETSPTKSPATWETLSAVSSQPSTQPDYAVVREQVDSSTHANAAPEAEVTTTDDQLEVSAGECQSQKNGEVSSTIKDVVESVPAPQIAESCTTEEPQSQETSEYPSSETGTATGTDDVIDLDYSYTDGDIEDSDEQSERRNPKTAAERENLALDSDEHQFSHGRPVRGFPRRLRGSPSGRGISGRFPRGPPGFPHYRQPLPNENFNPQTPQIVPDFQFRGAAPDHGPPTSTDFCPPPISSGYRPEFRGPQPFGMRGPFEPKPPGGAMFGPTMDSQFRGPRGMEFAPRGNRHQFRPFNPNGVRPSFRPNMPRMPPRMDGMRPPFVSSQASTSFPAPPRPAQSYPGPQNPMAIQQSSKMPRKVLINPNFKGGVEAATTQLMMDTLQHPQFINSISTHVSHLHSDEELLRQQEEFINKNRMHIEKRRHERSPERDRERDRDYSSPPPRRRAPSRERQARGGWRNRRESPDRGAEWRRRRRSASPERSKDEKRDKAPEDEDEETREYRIQIEKQKAMREKILRDKEMRRRKAAEEKAKVEHQQQQQQQVVEKKPLEPAPAPQKLTPLVVTESKIISLKRKAETSNLAPVASKQAANSGEELPDYADEDDGTPSPPPPRTHTPPQPPTSSSTTPQRRLVLKPTLDNQKMSYAFAADSTEAAAKPKGIFDRLEKKISVTDAAKRKIQRIVINNMDLKKKAKLLLYGREKAK